MGSMAPFSIKLANQDLVNRVWVHAGVELPTKVEDGGEPYSETAFVPVTERRRLSIRELTSIASPWHWPSSSCISSFAIPEKVLDEIRRADSPSARAPTSDEFHAMGAWLWTLICAATDVSSLGTPQWLGISRRQSGLRTSTFDYSTGFRIGMHLDSWDRAPLESRTFSRVRLCINMGVGVRGLLFLPYDIRAIREALADDATVHSANIGERYCAKYREALLMELEVPPGHAYLAPTENLIHDGCSARSPDHDITAAWLGLIQYGGSLS